MTEACDIEHRTSRRVPALALAAVAFAVAADSYGPIREADTGQEARAADRYVERGDDVAGVASLVAAGGGTVGRALPVFDAVNASLNEDGQAASDGFVPARGSARTERLVRDDGHSLTVDLREGVATESLMPQD